MTETATLQGSLRRSAARSTRQPRRLSAARIVRLVLAVMIAASGVLAVINEHAMRELEVQIASRVFPLVFASEAIPSFMGSDPAIAFEANGHWLALVITIECSIALYLGPLLLLAAGFFAMPRMSLVRVGIATVISFAAMAALNQARFIMLGSALASGGRETFEWMHSLVGSAMMVTGIAVCLMLFFRVVIVGSRRARARAKSVGGNL